MQNGRANDIHVSFFITLRPELTNPFLNSPHNVIQSESNVVYRIVHSTREELLLGVKKLQNAFFYCLPFSYEKQLEHCTVLYTFYYETYFDSGNYLLHICSWFNTNNAVITRTVINHLLLANRSILHK